MIRAFIIKELVPESKFKMLSIAKLHKEQDAIVDTIDIPQFLGAIND